MKKNYKLEKLVTALQEARKAKHITQVELAKQAGLGQSHVSRIEAGNLDIRATSLLEIARTLGFELMLIPKEYISVVSALTKLDTDDKAADEAAYIPQKEKEDE